MTTTDEVQQQRIIDWRKSSNILTWCIEGTQSLTQWEHPEFFLCSDDFHLRQEERGDQTRSLLSFMKSYWSRSCCYYAVSNNLVGVKVKLFAATVTNMITDEDTDDKDVGVPTSALSILLPHHHLLILFSSREKGNSLAEAEAALGARVMRHLGALRQLYQLGFTLCWHSHLCHNPSIKVHVRAVNILLTWWASLLSFSSPSSSCRCLRPSEWVGPWEPLRLVMGQDAFRNSDTICKMQDTSSGTAMPSASRICRNIIMTLHEWAS